MDVSSAQAQVAARPRLKRSVSGAGKSRNGSGFSSRTFAARKNWRKPPPGAPEQAAGQIVDEAVYRRKLKLFEPFPDGRIYAFLVGSDPL